MYYTDGKTRDNLEEVKKIEETFGIDQISPFGTSHKGVFEEKLETMKLGKMNALAEKVGCPTAANVDEQKKFLREAFRAFQTRNPVDYGQLSPQKKTTKNKRETKAQKQAKQVVDSARTKSVFEKEFPNEDVQSLKKILHGYTLSDLQNLSAKCGLNPIFDKHRAINNLVSEFERDLNMRPKV